MNIFVFKMLEIYFQYRKNVLNWFKMQLFSKCRKFLLYTLYVLDVLVNPLVPDYSECPDNKFLYKVS